MTDPQTSKQHEARRCTEAMRDLFLHFRAHFEEELRGTGVTLPLHAMLTRAVREGWIVRGTSDRNHRFVTAALTSKGKAIVRSGMALRERMEGELWKDIPVSALKNFREMLERGLANLERREREPGGASRHPNG